MVIVTGVRYGKAFSPGIKQMLGKHGRSATISGALSLRTHTYMPRLSPNTFVGYWFSTSFPFESKHCPLLTLSFSDRSSPPPPTTAVDTQGIEDQEVEDEVAKITQKSKSKSEAESSHEQIETMPQCEGVLGDFERRTCANPNTTLEEIEFRKVGKLLYE